MSAFTSFLTQVVCHLHSSSSWPFITDSSFRHRQAVARLFQETMSFHKLTNDIHCLHSFRTYWAWHFRCLNIIDSILVITYVRRWCNSRSDERPVRKLLRHLSVGISVAKCVKWDTVFDGLLPRHFCKNVRVCLFQ